ncbi:MAG TPA: 16S rRNA (guanine(527)-N(7))-methyltransferase RsmG [Rubricoccaceae bacterium]|nr:16S rRNA (guanine(527)-N(7))-methyltransferase RsmG [Rubricoccaceae bacterium]
MASPPSPPWNPLADLTPRQRAQLDAFAAELARVNRRVNLVSPATVPEVEERHLVHSLALAHRAFPAGATVVDWGSGGGLPAVPLAVRFPDVRFVAVDAVRKKTEAVRLFARRLGLANLDVWNGRAEAWDGAAHYAVSRATAPLADLWGWLARVRLPPPEVPEGCWAPGLVCLKGGDLTEEIAALHAAHPGLTVEQIPLAPLLGRAYFADKAIVSVREAAPEAQRV